MHLLKLAGRPEDAKKAVATFDHGELNGILEDRQKRNAVAPRWFMVGHGWGFSVEQVISKVWEACCMRRVELGRVGFVLLEGNSGEGYY